MNVSATETNQVTVGVAVDASIARYTRVGSVCWYCGSRSGARVLEHVTPISRGGGSDRNNLVIACRCCNSAKGSRTLEEFRLGIAKGHVFFGELPENSDLSLDLAPDPTDDPDRSTLFLNNPTGRLGL
ncbi:HNH endonuclease [Frankia sp. Cas4]|uniref:HNH endonuclease n=1 Tax=Frankia sp. Cas4 TaxID=3073927 RepID=UPI003A0FEADE